MAFTSSQDSPGAQQGGLIEVHVAEQMCALCTDVADLEHGIVHQFMLNRHVEIHVAGHFECRGSRCDQTVSPGWTGVGAVAPFGTLSNIFVAGGSVVVDWPKSEREAGRERHSAPICRSGFGHRRRRNPARSDHFPFPNGS